MTPRRANLPSYGRVDKHANEITGFSAFGSREPANTTVSASPLTHTHPLQFGVGIAASEGPACHFSGERARPSRRVRRDKGIPWQTLFVFFNFGFIPCRGHYKTTPSTSKNTSFGYSNVQHHGELAGTIFEFLSCPPIGVIMAKITYSHHWWHCL